MSLFPTRRQKCPTSAAPVRSVRQTPASLISNSLHLPEFPRRLRRRGPRSQIALLRRSLPKRCRALPGAAPGESGADAPVPLNFSPQQNSALHVVVQDNVPLSGLDNNDNVIASAVPPISNDEIRHRAADDFQENNSNRENLASAVPPIFNDEIAHRAADDVQENNSNRENLRNNERSKRLSKKSDISIYSINIRCLLKNKTELEAQLAKLKPQIVMLQETWLDASVEDVRIHGYRIISRRDRSETENRGGILTLVRDDFNGLAFISKCESEERAWHFLSMDSEVIFVGKLVPSRREYS